NWLAAVKSADQLVIISTVREDTFNAAAWMIDELRATGLAEQVDHAVTILSHSAKGKFDPTLRRRLQAPFGARTPAVPAVRYELRATGLAEQVDHAVTILSHSAKGKFDPTLRRRLQAHFGAHTRAVTEVPYEQQFVDGSHLDWERVRSRTKEAWLDATALIIDGL